MAQTLVFQCPHCGSTVELPDAAVGETAVCTNAACGRPFRVEVPAGKFVGARGLREGAAPGSDEHGGQFPGIGRDEQTLRVIHPAMFRRHPFLFLGYLVLAIGGGVGAAFFLSTGQAPLAAVCGAAALAGLVLFGLWYLQVLNVTLTLTTKRTIVRRGLFSKDTSEVRHDDVRNLQVEQSFLERVLGVGDVAVSSAGQDDLEIRVEGVPQPERVLELIREHQG